MSNARWKSSLEAYLLEGIPKRLPSFGAATRRMDEEQIDVGLLSFFGWVHLLDGFDKSWEEALHCVAFGVIEGLGC